MFFDSKSLYLTKFDFVNSSENWHGAASGCEEMPDLLTSEDLISVVFAV